MVSQRDDDVNDACAAQEHHLVGRRVTSNETNARTATEGVFRTQGLPLNQKNESVSLRTEHKNINDLLTCQNSLPLLPTNSFALVSYIRGSPQQTQHFVSRCGTECKHATTGISATETPCGRALTLSLSQGHERTERTRTEIEEGGVGL